MTQEGYPQIEEVSEGPQDAEDFDQKSLDASYPKPLVEATKDLKKPGKTVYFKKTVRDRSGEVIQGGDDE